MAASLDDDLLGQLVRRVVLHVLHRGVDLEHDDANALDLCRDLADSCLRGADSLPCRGLAPPGQASVSERRE